jgi:hypothetical protein
MKCFLVIAFLTVMSISGISIAGMSGAENKFGPEDWTSWEEVFASKEKNWKLIKDKKGIKVWARPVEMSPIKSFKGVTEFETSVGALTSLLLDTENYPQWMELVNVAEVLHRGSKTEVYRYTIHKLSWPLNTRDCCAYMKGYYHPETGAVVMRFMHTPDLCPRNKGYIRMPLMIGYYMAEPTSNGKVKFTFEAIVDMGGWLPTWVINFWLAEISNGTFRSIKGALPLDRYTGNEFDYTKDFSILKSPQY